MTVLAEATADADAPAAASASDGLTPSFWDRRAVRIVGGLLLPLMILAVWQAVTASGLVPPHRLASPVAVVEAAVQLADSGALWLHIAISVQRVLIGFAIGSIVGLAVAALVGLTRVGDVLLSPTLAAFRAIPSLALVPLLLLWMEIGEESKVTLIAIGAFFPVFTTVAAALRHVDPQLVEMGRSFGLRGWSPVPHRAAPGRRPLDGLGTPSRPRAVVAVPRRRRAARCLDGTRIPPHSTRRAPVASIGSCSRSCCSVCSARITNALVSVGRSIC